jgi:NAD(P)H-dependent FMN reductase
MKIGIISGSHRQDSESDKVAQYIARRLEGEPWCEQQWHFSLAGNPLPFWDEGIWSGDPQWQARLGPLSEALHSCDGFVVVTPEWHGMVPAGLKNFFLLWTAGGELAHKPALIVSVSASQNGAYPVAELRMSSYKNNRICYLPEHLIVRKAGRVFNADPANNDSELHAALDARLGYCLGILGAYSSAFRGIRASGKVCMNEFPNGM